MEFRDNIVSKEPRWWEKAAVRRDPHPYYGKEAILKAIETKPDIAVVDYALPLVNGAEVTRQIRARLPKTEVLIFTMHDTPSDLPSPHGN